MLSLIRSLAIALLIILSFVCSTHAMNAEADPDPERYLICQGEPLYPHDIVKIIPERYMWETAAAGSLEEMITNFDTDTAKFILFKVLNRCSQHLQIHTKVHLGEAAPFEQESRYSYHGYDGFCDTTTGMFLNSFYLLPKNDIIDSLSQYHEDNKKQTLFNGNVDNISDCIDIRFSLKSCFGIFDLHKQKLALKGGSTYAFDAIDCPDKDGIVEPCLQCTRFDFIPEFEIFKSMLINDKGSSFYQFPLELKQVIILATLRFEVVHKTPVYSFKGDFISYDYLEQQLFDKQSITAILIPFHYTSLDYGLYAFVQDVDQDLLKFNSEQINEKELLIHAFFKDSIKEPDQLKVQFVENFPTTLTEDIDRRILRLLVWGRYDLLGDPSTWPKPGIGEALIAGRQKKGEIKKLI